MVLVAVLVTSGCLQIGDDKSGAGGDAGTTTCGSAKVTAPTWAAACQSWLDRNCCAQQSTCSADPGCAQLVACIDACIASQPDTCSGTCKGQALTDAIGRYDAVGTCTASVGDADGGVSATLPAGCAWP